MTVSIVTTFLSKPPPPLVSISIAVIKHSNLGEDRVYFTLEFGARAKAEL